MSANAENPTRYECCYEGGELARDVLSSTYCVNCPAAKRAGRFARRDTLMGIYKRSEGEGLGEDSVSKNSPGVGNRDVGDKVLDPLIDPSGSSGGVGNRDVGDKVLDPLIDPSGSSGGVGN
ncbi:hypothetical protein DEU56DRAFT_752413 [Suillus clintonianus]|uniref:uncharacterized protein n=1 Tax=Suillus clintonianus TaxID=1904413 RepID=UPI001B882D47|nr:uncharacterized protein DEU56DRAFT_752413 [Suillus clintonianus]KAG2151524.1 hypothetical protein DEU56DRAFT_752413 [Suillus clintonianus]